MSKREWPLDLENVGGDTYSLLSRGHHDIHEFMRQVRAEGFDWPLGMPKHIWLRCVPPPDGYATWYVEAKEGARGAFPATQCWEAYNEDTYEAITAAEKGHTSGTATTKTGEASPNTNTTNERKNMKLVLKNGSDNTEREMTNDEALEILVAQYGEHSARIFLSQLLTGEAKTASVGVNRGIFATPASTPSATDQA